MAFSMTFTFVTQAFDIPVGNYIETYGINSVIGEMSVYVVPPIVIIYYIIKKIQHKTKPNP